ncbi:glycosyltransferase [Nocardioides ungokensis]
MKILHVATLLSPDGAYGGPVRVAEHLTTELAARGHEVELAASFRGFDTAPTRAGDVPLRLKRGVQAVPGIGFAGWSSPRLLFWALRNIRKFDLVHIHMARDLVTLPIAIVALILRVPFVIQTHGMIDASDNPLSRPLDLILTIPVLRRARAVCYLTPRERRDLQAVAGTELRLIHLPNGVPRAPESAASGDAEVLFLARLHERKRPLIFAQAAVDLQAAHPSTRFTMVGPDEGSGEDVRRLIDEFGAGLLSWEGAVAPAESLARMQHASIYVLPSVDEPFPMTVLEALSIGLPVVVTRSCGLASEIDSAQAGVVVDDDDVAQVASAIDLLLSNAALRNAMSLNARSLSTSRFSLDVVGERLVEIYGLALNSVPLPAPSDPLS